MKTNSSKVTNFLRALSAIICLVLTGTYAECQLQGPSDIMGDRDVISNADLVSAQKTLSAYVKANDMVGFRRYVSSLEHTWRQKSPRVFAEMMYVSACAIDYKSPQTPSDLWLKQRCIDKALSLYEMLPISLDVDLLGQLPDTQIVSRLKTWPKIREFDASVIAIVWRKVQDGSRLDVDTSALSDHLDLAGTEPPLAAQKEGVMRGSDPSDIKDPVLRAEYIRAIQRDKDIEAEVVTIGAYRSMLTMFNYTRPDFHVDMLRDHLAYAYSLPPYNIDQLKKILTTNHIDKQDYDYVLRRVWQIDPKAMRSSHK